jgi:predicted metal-dependent hydrolase
LHRHRAWIERQLARLAKEEPKRVGGGLPTALELRALSERWGLEYQPYAATRRQVIERAGRSLALNCEASDTASASALLAPWLREKARSYLIPRLAQLSKETGLDYRCVQIKWQRTLWGSCSSKRRINLSARLIFLPPELVRYVLVHELCHTKHCNHSARFWRLVAVFEPAYRERKGALRQTRSLVPGFLEG